MHSGQVAPPAIEDRGRSREIVLIKPSAAVSTRKEPLMCVARLPRGRGEKRNYRSSRARSSEDSGEEVTTRGVKGNQRTLVHLPGIVTGAAVQGGRRDASATACAGKERGELRVFHYNAAPQITRPWLRVRDRQRVPRTPLSAVVGVDGNHFRLQQHQCLVVLVKVENGSVLLPDIAFADGQHGHAGVGGVLRARHL